jgi:hypothetical protein
VNKRILKTGALAVAVTIAFALFAYQAAKWSFDTQPGVAALGQRTITDNDPCSASGAEQPGIPTTKIIPQLAFGSFDSGLSNYTTIIEIVNISGGPQNIAARFYKDDGSALDNVALKLGDSTINDGVLAATQVPEGGILVISGGGNSSRGILGWSRITACGGVSIAAFFELRDVTRNLLVGRSAIAAGPGNLSSFVMPRIREVLAGLDVAFAVVNTAEAAATLKAEVKDASGKTVASKDLVLGPRSQRTGFTKEIFTDLKDDNNRIYQYLKFTSTSPSFAAIALAIEGGIQTNFPVEVVP